MIPQIIEITWILVALFVFSHYHGKEKTGKYNFFIALISQLIQLAILYYGGFFDVFLNK